MRTCGQVRQSSCENPYAVLKRRGVGPVRVRLLVKEVAMTGAAMQGGNAGRWLYRAAVGVAFAWAIWWILFSLMSGIAESGDLLGGLIHVLVPGLVYLAAAVLAWWKWRAGAILLAIEGLATLWFFTFARTPLGLLILALPPLAAALLFVLADRAGRDGAHA